MNKTLEKAYEIFRLQLEKDVDNHIDWDITELPILEIGDVCTIGDVWSGDGDYPDGSYSYFISDCGEDGESNIDIWLDYQWEVLEEKEDCFDTVIRITGIELI